MIALRREERKCGNAALSSRLCQFQTRKKHDFSGHVFLMEKIQVLIKKIIVRKYQYN